MKQQLKSYEEKMTNRIGALNSEYLAMRAGRANPSVLDKIRVEYYGTPTAINQVASVSVAEARVLTIQPFDSSILTDIERAISIADIGIHPTSDGKVIRLTFPQLTEERRKDLVKGIHKTAEEFKVSIRNIRREALDKFKVMKKDNEITEDELKSSEKDMQNLTDKYCKEIDTLSQTKEKEILSI